MWSLTRTVAVFINDECIGSDLDFLHYISQYYIFNLPIGVGYYENLAEERCKRFMDNSKVNFSYIILPIQ